MPKRTTIELSLKPAAGYRFQPTGFPNLGAAVFERPASGGGWVKALHVESPQSMANRLEATTWDDVDHAQVEALAGIPYVQVVNADGEFLTSSRLEAHRLASAYIMDGAVEGETGSQWIGNALGMVKGAAIDHRKLAAAIFQLDPLSLIHGVFFARKEWPWQPKVARAVTCFIDADDVRIAASGGVKTDSVDTRGDTGAGYGMVPHQRIEYTAQNITAHVTIDRQQIAGYGLGPTREELLNALIDFEVAHLFGEGGLRLRTACDLEVISEDSGKLPDAAESSRRVAAAIEAMGSELPGTHTVQWSGPAKKASKTDQAS